MITESSQTALLPSKYGEFSVQAFKSEDGLEHIAVICGDVDGGQDMLVRIHSECFTGDILGSLKCDCGPQLQQALQQIDEEGRGILVYLRQEGRGIGLVNKINAYNLQENGLDTVEANHQLGFPADLREYDIAAEILKTLGVNSIRLLTNNKQKVTGLEEYGIEVSELVPLKIEPNPHNQYYLETKKIKLDHLL